MSVVDMANAVKTRKISPVELVSNILALIEKLNPKVNAYCTLAAENARKKAIEAENAVLRQDKLGPLHGVPVSIKDLIDTEGIRTTYGSKVYENFIPTQSAIVVQRLEAAGAIVVGKTNTPEFGWTGTTYNKIFGKTRNPWDLNRTSGGSSGGAAAAVAACISPLAIGSDGGGSIRIPSSFCGVFGFKPSFGYIPRYPELPGWETLDHLGPITRTVEDAAIAMEIISGWDNRDHYAIPVKGLRFLPLKRNDLKGLTVAWSKDLGQAIVEPEVLNITGAAVKVFANLGAKIEDASPKVKNPESAYSTYVGVRMATVFKDRIEAGDDLLDPYFARFIKLNINKKAIEYAAADFEMNLYRHSILTFFNKYDLLLTPVIGIPAFSIDMYAPKEIAGVKVSPMGWAAFTYPFNITGQPAASVPCGWTDSGLPVGIQIVGRRFDDVKVLNAAAAFEQAAPWNNRLPPLLNGV